MNWLGTYLNENRPPQQNGPEIVDKLCDRVVNSSLLEDRRAAVLGLKGLSKQYQLVRSCHNYSTNYSTNIIY